MNSPRVRAWRVCLEEAIDELETFAGAAEMRQLAGARRELRDLDGIDTEPEAATLLVRTSRELVALAERMSRGGLGGVIAVRARLQDASNALGASGVGEGSPRQPAEEVARDTPGDATGPDRRAVQFRSLGAKLAAEGQFAEAAGQFQQGLAAGPEDSDLRASLHFCLGECWRLEGRFAEAAGQYRQGLDAGPRDPDGRAGLHLGLGECWRREGRYAEAAGQYQQGLAAGPKDPGLRAGLHVRLGECWRHEGRFAEAAGQYQQGLAAGPEDSDQRALMHYCLGVCWGLEGRHAEAAGQYQQGLAAGPKDSDVRARLLLVLGDCWRREGRFAEAAEQYLQGLDLRPEDPDLRAILHSGLAECWRREGRFAEAAGQYQQGLAAAPEDTDLCVHLHWGLGECWRREGRLAEAAGQDQQGLDLRPNDPDLRFHLHFSLGECWRLDGRYAEAAGQFQQGLAAGPEVPDLRASAHFSVGECWCHEGRYAEAAGQFQLGLAAGPKDPDQRAHLHHRLGECWRLEGRYAEAAAQFQQGLDAGPGDPGRRAELHLGLGWLAERKSSGRAWAHFEKALEAMPAHSQAHLSVLRLLLAAPDTEPPTPGAPVTALLALQRMTTALEGVLDLRRPADVEQAFDSLVSISDLPGVLRALLRREGAAAVPSLVRLFGGLRAYVQAARGAPDEVRARLLEALFDAARLLTRLVEDRLDAAWTEPLQQEAQGLLATLEADRALLASRLGGPANVSLWLRDLAFTLAGVTGDAERRIPRILEEEWTHTAGELREFEGRRERVPFTERLLLLAFRSHAMELEDPSPDAQVLGLLRERIHFLFELLPAGEVGHRSRSARSPLLERLAHWLGEPGSALLTLDETRARLGKGQLLLRFRWLEADQAHEAAVLIMLLLPGDAPPRLVLREGDRLPDGLLRELERADAVQQTLMAIESGGDWRPLAAKLDQLTADESVEQDEQRFRDRLGAIVVRPWQQLGGLLLDEVVTADELQGRELLLSPPARCFQWPWLALPVPGGDRPCLLLDLVSSLRLLPVASPPAASLDTPTGQLGLVAPEFGNLPGDRLRTFERWLGSDPHQLDELITRLRGKEHVHLIAHLSWPDQPTEDGRTDLHGLVERLLQADPPLGVRRMVLETCDASRPVGRGAGERYQALVLSVLAAGAEEVLGAGYTIRPGDFERRAFREELYRALESRGGAASLGAATVRATRHVRDTLPEGHAEPDPLRILPAFLAPMTVVGGPLARAPGPPAEAARPRTDTTPWDGSHDRG